MSDRLFILLDEQAHVVKSGRMAFGRKPTWISGPDANGTLVLHVTGSQFSDGTYKPSHFLVLRVESYDRARPGLIDCECSVVVEIAGIPKKPSKRRGGAL